MLSSSDIQNEKNAVDLNIGNLTQKRRNMPLGRTEHCDGVEEGCRLLLL